MKRTHSFLLKSQNLLFGLGMSDHLILFYKITVALCRYYETMVHLHHFKMSVLQESLLYHTP